MPVIVAGCVCRRRVSRAGLDVLRADVTDGSALASVIAGCDAVASVLGASYSRKPVTVYSRGTRAIVAGMQETGCRRLIVVSSGLTYPPGPGHGFFFDRIAHPLLRNVFGRNALRGHARHGGVPAHGPGRTPSLNYLLGR
jgi:nucleoside-diphosphate-sugar epimerase